MRTEPEDKYADIVAHRKMMVAKITRLVAIGIAAGGTFFFFIKLLFL